MRIAQIVVDNRQEERRYDKEAPWFGTAPQGLFQGFAMLKDSIEVHVISCTQQPMRSPEKLAPNIYFHSLHVPKIGWLRTGYSGCIRAIGRKLWDISPDIVHAQGTERECAMGAAFAPLPKILTIHGNLRLIARFFQAPLWSTLGLQSKLEGWVIPRFDGVLCISRYTQGAVSGLARRTWLLPNAADAACFDLESKRVPSTPEFLFVATVDARKNQVAFIDAVAPLAEKRDFRLRFLGHVSPESEYGRAFMNRVNKYRWCQHDGFVSRGDLHLLLCTARALVLPSNEDNCPMTVLEAMAAGVPVMASAVGGIPDLVEDNLTGLLCDPTNAGSMRDAFQRLLEDDILARNLARQGREKARTNFHPRAVGTRHVEIYREVLRRKGKVARGFDT